MTGGVVVEGRIIRKECTPVSHAIYTVFFFAKISEIFWNLFNIYIHLYRMFTDNLFVRWAKTPIGKTHLDALYNKMKKYYENTPQKTGKTEKSTESEKKSEKNANDFNTTTRTPREGEMCIKRTKRIRPFKSTGRRGSDPVMLGDMVIPTQTFKNGKWVDDDDYDRVL